MCKNLLENIAQKTHLNNIITSFQRFMICVPKIDINLHWIYIYECLFSGKTRPFM